MHLCEVALVRCWSLLNVPCRKSLQKLKPPLEFSRFAFSFGFDLSYILPFKNYLQYTYKWYYMDLVDYIERCICIQKHTCVSMNQLLSWSWRGQKTLESLKLEFQRVVKLPHRNWKLTLAIAHALNHWAISPESPSWTQSRFFFVCLLFCF